MNLKLKKPIVFFDLETTGINITDDRIIEFSYIKLFPDGRREDGTMRFNPERHIPERATAVHGISDADVADKPTFRQRAGEVAGIFADSDIAGFNSTRFDAPLLIEEFNRANVAFPLEGRRFIDAQAIYHKREQRTLAAAYLFYCGKQLENAHSATADVEATMEVLLAQCERYPDIRQNCTIETLAAASDNNSIDLAGRIIRDSRGVAVFNFGKHKGKSVEEVFAKEPSYYDWIMQNDFSKTTKDVVTALHAQLKARGKK